MTTKPIPRVTIALSVSTRRGSDGLHLDDVLHWTAAIKIDPWWSSIASRSSPAGAVQAAFDRSPYRILEDDPSWMDAIVKGIEHAEERTLLRALKAFADEVRGYATVTIEDP